MPALEPVVLSGNKISLRLIGPRAAVWQTSPATNLTLLNRSDLVARPLPASQQPNSPDLVSGSYTLRLGDAGEQAWTYPNGPASDGVPYRQKFDPTGHLMFLEISIDDVLEQVAVIDTVNPTDGRGFSSTLDATDFCSSLWGNGAGFQNGSVGQLQAVVFDPATLSQSLFDVQGWQDFSDAAFPSLLQALLNAQLGLRLTPWQLLSADPTGSGGGGQVLTHGQDAMFLLKKAYERDWTVTQAPRDVIERGTQVWKQVTFDNFPAGSLSPQWTVTGSSAVIGPSGGLVMTGPAGGDVTVDSPVVNVAATGTWRIVLATVSDVFGAGGLQFANVTLQVTESSGDVYWLEVGGGGSILGRSNWGETAVLPTAPAYTLMIESDGEWISGYINGQLIGTPVRRSHATTTSLQTEIQVFGGSSGATTVTAASVLMTAMQPFIGGGTDKGDYALPGNASTYPSGGLHARYSNNIDLQSDGLAPRKVHAPSRMQSYGAAAPAEYIDQQDPTINGQQNPQTGAATTWWSCIWFGAIWLPLSKGSFTFAFTIPPGGSARVWIGKTQFGQQLLDQWPGTAGTYTFTVNAAALAGTLSYGGGTVQRDGWYPIKIEYGVDGTAATAPILYFYNTPAAYTDPGGTLIPQATNTEELVPATSLSPLGCVDQRYQGIAHFDLAQQTLQAYGYQASLEPYKFETLGMTNQPGYFPGQLAPRIREGHDTALKLVPDKTARDDWTGPLRPQLAATWPLPGAIAPMRWRPGDGLLVRDQEISVWDTEPRQILTFTRNLLPDGIASAVASLANRPRGEAQALKQQFFAATRWQRNYQRQRATLTGSYIDNTTVGAGATSPASLVTLSPGDTVVAVRLRIGYNVGGVPLNVLVNGTDETATLNGPWTTVPLTLDLSAVAAPDNLNRLYAQVKVPGATGTTVSAMQLLVDVVR